MAFEGRRDAITPELLDELRFHKPALLDLLRGSHAPDRDSILEWFQERAAIMEADGHLSAEEANREARKRSVVRFMIRESERLQ